MKTNYNENDSKYIDGNLSELCKYLLSQVHEPNSIKIDLDIDESSHNSLNNLKNVFGFLLDLFFEILKEKYNITKLNDSFEKLNQTELEFIASKFAAIGIKLCIDISENVYNTDYLENLESLNKNTELPDLDINNSQISNNIAIQNQNQTNLNLSSYFISLKYLNNNYKIFFKYL